MDGFIKKFSLEGRKAIVTGGAKGLCNSMAQALHDAGAEVVLVDILDMVEDSAEKMSKSGAPVHAVKADLSKENLWNLLTGIAWRSLEDVWIFFLMAPVFNTDARQLIFRRTDGKRYWILI